MSDAPPDRRRAAAAYAAAGRLAHSPESVVALLHATILGELRSAKTAYERKALDQMCRHTAKATRILTGLILRLDFERAGPPGLALRGLYIRLRNEVMHVLRDADVAPRLQRASEIIQTLLQVQETSKVEIGERAKAQADTTRQ